jgi:NADH-quinone oxidoreductase subunit L
MKLAMGALAVLALVGGLLQIPGVVDAVRRFLDPSFADSRFAHVQVGTGSAWIGLVIGAVVAVIGIGIAYRIWIGVPAVTTTLRERFTTAYLFLSNKWYFDELIDVAVVRPSLWLGGVVGAMFERTLIGGVVTGGPVGVVRAGSAAVRRSQTGYLRYYAAAMIICMFGVALYFLVVSS